MMNDKEFKQKCHEIIYYQLDELDKYLKSREGMYSTGFDSDIAIATSLLYIAANMPNLNGKDNKPEASQDKCPYCAGGEVTLTSFESEAIEDSYITLLFDPEDGTLCVRDDSSHVEGCVDISNCPMCGREL